MRRIKLLYQDSNAKKMSKLALMHNEKGNKQVERKEGVADSTKQHIQEVKGIHKHVSATLSD